MDEDAVGEDRIKLDDTVLKYPFRSGDEMLRLANETGLSISSLMLENEKAWRTEDEIREGLLEIWRVMQACVSRGMSREGILPGGLRVKRRAASTARQLRTEGDPMMHRSEWTTIYAMAVNEENAAAWPGRDRPDERRRGRPAGGPALLRELRAGRGRGRRGPLPARRGRDRHALQGERLDLRRRGRLPGRGRLGLLHGGGALAEVLGGTPEQVENAAEIGMEHNLGLTCDPVGGLVQIPCIERNGMAAVKAVTAAKMAMRGDGSHKVSLDKVIKTMKETGADMKVKYKETARGGLAVNVIEC